ncbi:MAG: type II secretion system GspH family protein [Fusobacterium sp.]|nr:type II secretion system GspH family protein [Fusobacterium sp.]
MAEILLSLTIIGVVAAITLPSLTGNINERTWNTQRKALYARMSQAIALMPALNGYGSTTENMAETFVTAGLSKVLKINNICDSQHLENCGISSSFTDMHGSKKSIPRSLYNLNPKFHLTFVESDGTSKTYSQLDTKAAGFETANGESILTFYNPACQSELQRDRLEDFSQDKMCVNFIYDLNGNKGPNTVGKDMGFITVLYPSDSVVVAPFPEFPLSETVSQQLASSSCRNKSDDARLPNLYEYMSIFYNMDMIGEMGTHTHFWTSTVISSTLAKCFHMDLGRIYEKPRNEEYSVQCVKR